jgi:hypothetical protein
MCFLVFVADKVVGVGGSGSGDTTTDNVQTILETFLNMAVRSACSIDETFFLVKSRPSGLGTTLHKCRLSGFLN